MKLLTRTSRSGVVAGLSGILVAAGFVGLPAAPAQAAAPEASAVAGSFNWAISDQVGARMPTREYTDGAFEKADKVASFPQHSVTTQDGDISVSYKGSVKTKFEFGGTLYYWVQITDPEVTLGADGSGALEAEVSAWSAASTRPPATPEESTAPARVVVGEFSSSEGALASTLSATIGGFSDDFVSQVTEGVKAHFNGDSETKQPAPFAIAAPSTTAAVSGDKTSVGVAGVDFFGGDANYQGVYVGIAPSGGLPDTTTPAGMEAFAGQDWVMPGAIVNGAFTRNLAVEVDELVPGQSYSLYTWQAHRHSTNALDTEVNLGILKAKPVTTVKKASTTTLKVNKAATRTKAGRATAKVTGKEGKATGKVKVTIKMAGVKKARTSMRTLNGQGKVVVKLPKAKKKGQYKVTVKYAGNVTYKPGAKVVKKFKVKK